jgi:uncharacterized surface protein with fasciclin (FAS1) repeats
MSAVETQSDVGVRSAVLEGSGDNIKVNNAAVICGGVQTANATVYMIDTVMMPPAPPAM